MLFELLTRQLGWIAGLALLIVIATIVMAVAALAPRLLEKEEQAAWQGDEVRRFLANVTTDNNPWVSALMAANRLRMVVSLLIAGSVALIFSLLANAHHVDLSRQIEEQSNSIKNLEGNSIKERVGFGEEKQRLNEEHQRELSRRVSEERAACEAKVKDVDRNNKGETNFQISILNNLISEKDKRLQEFAKHVEEHKRYEEDVRKYAEGLRQSIIQLGGKPPELQVRTPIDLPSAVPPPPFTGKPPGK